MNANNPQKTEGKEIVSCHDFRARPGRKVIRREATLDHCSYSREFASIRGLNSNPSLQTSFIGEPQFHFQLLQLNFCIHSPYGALIPVPQIVIDASVLNDPNHEMVLELAVAARCDYIVTFNQRDFGGAETFGLQVIRPSQFLRFIGDVL